MVRLSEFICWLRKHQKVHKIVLANCKLKVCEIAEKLKISEGDASNWSKRKLC